MSLRNRLVVPALFSFFALLAGCSSNSGITHPTPPPGGSFSASNLNGTYVFSVQGTDATGAAYSMAGTFTANGQGGITAGTIDINDSNTSVLTTGPLANQSVNSNSSYRVQVDGRGTVTLNTSTPFQQVVFDFVLADSSHGMISEFDGNATSSGTFDLQTSGVTPTGSYAFSFFGFSYSGGVVATAGNFTVGAGGVITSGFFDLNDNGLPYAGEPLSGNVALGPSATPATTLTPSGTFNSSLVYDVFAVDANHLKFIEMDQFATTSGDAYSQTSTNFPHGTLAFTLAGADSSGAAAAAGGFMITDGAGGITNGSTEDINDQGSVSQSPAFTANYTAAGTGRYTISNFSGFFGGTTYAAYPSSGGIFLLEIDSSGLMSGTAYLQNSSATFNESAGYALDLSGANLSQRVEVDDIAEFASNSNGTIVKGVIDENYQPGGGPNGGYALNGNYALPDSNGRGQISANAGSSSNSTLNGGFQINYYMVDGTNFPFLEVDGGGQVAVGVFSLQNATASASAAASKSHLSLFRPFAHTAARVKRQK